MLRSPRATLNSVVVQPRSIDLAILIVFIAGVCSAGFLMTRVGQLAALDQQVRQLESFGAVINDETYAELRRWVPYRPVISAAVILMGWPGLWVALAAIAKAVGNHTSRRQVTFAQVHAVIVHASAVFALRSVIAAPVNYARESIGGATSSEPPAACVWRVDVPGAVTRGGRHFRVVVGSSRCDGARHSV